VAELEALMMARLSPTFGYRPVGAAAPNDISG
jgi:hypothetical protein